jgi:hydroxyacyl-ACP dehydratase HTD2-like protein with hotdog domain
VPRAEREVKRTELTLMSRLHRLTASSSWELCFRFRCKTDEKTNSDINRIAALIKEENKSDNSKSSYHFLCQPKASANDAR